MECPDCGREMEKGIVKAQEAGSLLNTKTLLSWYPDADKGKLVQKNAISLFIKGNGFYCSECMKVFAVFEER